MFFGFVRIPTGSPSTEVFYTNIRNFRVMYRYILGPIKEKDIVIKNVYE